MGILGRYSKGCQMYDSLFINPKRQTIIFCQLERRTNTKKTKYISKKVTLIAASASAGVN
jgi:hypothetical protein